VTGFMIPSVDPPTGETDGPLGAILLARAFASLGIETVLMSDDSAMSALRSAVSILPELGGVAYAPLPRPRDPKDHRERDTSTYREQVLASTGELTHLIALERVGVNHRPRTIRREPASTVDTVVEFIDLVPQRQRERCFTMRGRDITDLTSPAHLLFERPRPYVTIGIGDGGNEIGMGKIPWATIHKNIPRGYLIACSMPTDHLIVAGVSNWGAYALAAGVMILRHNDNVELFNADREKWILENMVEHGPLVDGVTGQRTATVDGLTYDEYAKPLKEIQMVLQNPTRDW